MTQENISLQPNEEITPIQGYEDLYSITSFGRVWSHEKVRRFGWGYGTYRAKFLKLYLNKHGYLTVGFHLLDKTRRYRVNRLVAQAFIPNPNNFPEVNHKDGNKQNNYAGTAANNYTDGNLEWCDSDFNIKHAMENGLRYKISSDFYGVSFNRSHGHHSRPWGVNLRDRGKQIYGGFYKTELEAAKAYNDYVIKHNLKRSLNNI